MAQMVKNLPAKQEILGREDPLEKGMATHSSILAWKNPWTEEPGRPQSMGLQCRTLLSTCIHYSLKYLKDDPSVDVNKTLG